MHPPQPLTFQNHKPLVVFPLSFSTPEILSTPAHSLCQCVCNQFIYPVIPIRLDHDGSSLFPCPTPPHRHEVSCYRSGAPQSPTSRGHRRGGGRSYVRGAKVKVKEPLSLFLREVLCPPSPSPSQNYTRGELPHLGLPQETEHRWYGLRASLRTGLGGVSTRKPSPPLSADS